MRSTHSRINKSASVIYRLSQMFCDTELAPCNIGCGQQFFLLKICEQPGITLLELAQKGYFDKGTTARAVQKLEALNYIRREIDTEDRRSSKLYITESAEPIIQIIEKVLTDWNEVLTQKMTEEEVNCAKSLMEKMADNAIVYMNKRKREKE